MLTVHKIEDYKDIEFQNNAIYICMKITLIKIYHVENTSYNTGIYNRLVKQL